MEKIKCDLSRFKKKDTKLCKYEFQQYAKDTCQQFGVIHPYDKIIFKYAKSNLTFLKAQVTNLQEQANYKGDDLTTYGKLLTWKLNQHKQRKKVPKYCQSCGAEITKKQHYRGTAWTENGETKIEYHHINCLQ